MKLGCSSWSYHRTFEAGTLDQRRWLHKCRQELKLDGVELLDVHFPRTDLDYLREVKLLTLDLDLTISAVSVSNNFGWASAEKRLAEVEKVKHWIDVAHFVGAPVLRIFAGWPERDHEQDWPAMVDSVRDVTQHARAQGIVLAVENHNHDGFIRTADDVLRLLDDVTQHARAQGIVLAVENHNHDGFIRTADDVLRLLDDVPSPWLQLLLDTGNFTDLYDSMERTADRAVFVHAKLYDVDPEQGEQRLDYERIMAILRQVDYNGYLSIEYEGEAAEEPAVAAGVRYLRALID